jgi:hypothetical protein
MVATRAVEFTTQDVENDGREAEDAGVVIKTQKLKGMSLSRALEPGKHRVGPSHEKRYT